MNKLDELLDRAYDYGLEILENFELESDAEALLYYDVIGLSTNIQTQIEKKCALAEELSHYEHNIGNILNMQDPKSRQQEYRARREAIFELITPDDLIRAFEYRVNSLYEMAEFLEVTEKHLVEALSVYKQRYGNIMNYEDYIISFEPFYVAQNFEYRPYELY